MAHSSMHFAVGLALGTAWMAIDLSKSILRRTPSASIAGFSLLRAYGLGLLAMIPNILRHAGLPDVFCSGWWMNVFLLNPLLDQIKPGGLLVGELGIVACWSVQYSLLLVCLNRNKTALPTDE